MKRWRLPLEDVFRNQNVGFEVTLSDLKSLFEGLDLGQTIPAAAIT